MIGCLIEGGSEQLVAFDRDTAGRIVTMGTVVSTTGEIRAIRTDDTVVSSTGTVTATLGDYQTCCDDQTPVRWQHRGYRWRGGRFEQVAGPTRMSANPSVTQIRVGTGDLVLGPVTNDGYRYGTVTVNLAHGWGIRPARVQLSRSVTRCIGTTARRPGFARWTDPAQRHAQHEGRGCRMAAGHGPSGPAPAAVTAICCKQTASGGAMNRYPLRVEAHRDEPLSRWLWLVKWLLLIPHYVVLLFLFAGMVVMTLAAYVAVLFTGRYPHAIAAYNLGVLRWAWRVGYYGYEALGTDRYPPFTLADVPDYPARLELAEPPRPPRWLPLVAWLFAIPHVLIVLALSGAIAWQGDIVPGGRTAVPLGVVTVGILIAGFGLLFAGRYPRGLYDLLVGIGRWTLRATAYLALLTPRYPPFRLDQGDHEPDDDGPPPASAPAATAATRRGGVAGPVIALVAGVLLLAPAAGLTIGGGALLALDGARDDAGYVTSPAVSVQSSTAAITAEGITLQAGDLWTRGLSDIGGVRISVTGRAGTDLFVGIAAESDVDSWLSGVAHDELSTVSRGAGSYDRAPGVRGPVAAPAAQDFWLATGTGTGAATVTWKATTGNFAVVLANADGSTGLVADVRAATQVPDLTGLGAGLLTTGILLALAAIALIVVGGVGLGRRHGAAPPPSGPPPGPPVAGPPPVHATTPE